MLLFYIFLYLLYCLLSKSPFSMASIICCLSKNIFPQSSYVFIPSVLHLAESVTLDSPVTCSAIALLKYCLPLMVIPLNFLASSSFETLLSIILLFKKIRIFLLLLGCIDNPSCFCNIMMIGMGGKAVYCPWPHLCVLYYSFTLMNVRF